MRTEPRPLLTCGDPMGPAWLRGQGMRDVFFQELKGKEVLNHRSQGPKQLLALSLTDRPAHLSAQPGLLVETHRHFTSMPWEVAHISLSERRKYSMGFQTLHTHIYSNRIVSNSWNYRPASTCQTQGELEIKPGPPTWPQPVSSTSQLSQILTRHSHDY